MASLSGTLLSLIDYDAWATARVIDAAARLSPARLDEPSANPDWTVRAGLAHVLDASAYWLGQMERRRAPDIDGAMLPDIEAMHETAGRVSVALRAFVAGLSADDLAREVMRRPGAPTRNMQEAVTHVLVHSGHHRGELAALLTTLGASPGDLDYMDFLRERDGLPPYAGD